MNLVVYAVASVTPMEALLFTAVEEQQNSTDCAQAVVESIAAQFWRTPVAAPRESEDEDFSMSVREIHTLLLANELTNRAFWMTWQQLHETITRYGPVIVHLEEPTGHYAVAVGSLTSRDVKERSSGGEYLLLADPARGGIIVSDGWWKRHSSGATVVVDTDWDVQERDLHQRQAQARLRRLEVARDNI